MKGEATEPAGRAGEAREEVDGATRRGDEDWREVQEELREVVDEVRTSARRCVDAAPLGAVGLAAGVGFVLGGGLPQGVTAAVWVAALRAGASYFGSDLGDWLENLGHEDPRRADDARARHP